MLTATTVLTAATALNAATDAGLPLASFARLPLASYAAIGCRFRLSALYYDSLLPRIDVSTPLSKRLPGLHRNRR